MEMGFGDSFSCDFNKISRWVLKFLKGLRKMEKRIERRGRELHWGGRGGLASRFSRKNEVVLIFSFPF